MGKHKIYMIDKLHDEYGDAAEVLMSGGVVVLPTDTTYGVVARAKDPVSVQAVYELRKRDEAKPCIVLISDIRQITEMCCDFDENTVDAMSILWNEKYNLLEKQERINAFFPYAKHIKFTTDAFSIIVNCKAGKENTHLHRGTNTIAFRIPLQESHLRSLIRFTGPLIAPSANIQGLPTPTNMKEIKKMFGDRVQLYIGDDAYSEENINPSHVIKINESKLLIVR